MTDRPLRVAHILEPDGSVNPLSATCLQVLCAFPEDDASMRQAIAILGDEYQRFVQLGPKDYCFSDVCQCVLDRMAKSAGQRFVAGGVALAMLRLRQLGERASLESASRLVSEVVYMRGKVVAYRYTGKEISVKEAIVPSDQADIKDAWRRYRSVAPYCAAQIVTEIITNPLRHPFEADDVVTAKTISTSVAIHSTLSTNVKESVGWNFWHINLPKDWPIDVFTPVEPNLFGFDEALKSLRS